MNAKYKSRIVTLAFVAAMLTTAATILFGSPVFSQTEPTMQIIMSIAWSPDGTRIATGDRHGLVKIYDAISGTLQQSIQAGPGEWSANTPYVIRAIAWSPDGNHIIASVNFWGGGGEVQVIDTNSGQIQFTGMSGYDTPSVAWSPDGSMFAAGFTESAHPLCGARVRVWDATSYELIAYLKHSRAVLTSIAWSPDGTWLASASIDAKYDYDTFVKVWDTTTWDVHVTLDGVQVEWRPDGTQLDDMGTIWDTSTWLPLVDLQHSTAGMLDIAWQPNTDQIAGLTTSSLVFWDASSGEIVAELPLTADPPGIVSENIAWSPDGSVLVYGVNDQIVEVSTDDGTTWQVIQ